MPRPDLPKTKPVRMPSPAALRSVRLRMEAARRVRRPGPGRRGEGEPGGEPCPVEPDHPLDLSGGAAATLAFDE